MITPRMPGVARIRRVGVTTAANKMRTRCWSTRTSIVVARGTTDGATSACAVELSFDICPSEAFDAGELPIADLHGAELLYVEGLAHLFRKGPGDAITARDDRGRLLAVGLLAYGDRFSALDRASPALYHPIAFDECWTEAHYVLPAERNRRILGALLAAERKRLAAMGYRRVLAMIDLNNAPSLRGFGREGYEPTGTIRVDLQRLNTLSSQFTQLDAAALARWRAAQQPR